MGCKKTIFDYRHKYIGDWDITIVRTSWWAMNEEIDTTIYKAEISYGNDNDEIYINNTPYPCLQFSVSKKGVLTCSNQKNPIGEISKKKIEFTYCYMSPGSHTTIKANGQKR